MEARGTRLQKNGQWGGMVQGYMLVYKAGRSSPREGFLLGLHDLDSEDEAGGGW